jgi:hypothetical protein
MPNGANTLIVPTLLPTGSLQFAEIPEDGQAQDVIDALLKIDGLKEEVLGDLKQSGWALQRIRTERRGRPREEEELMALEDGLSNFHLKDRMK